MCGISGVINLKRSACDTDLIRNHVSRMVENIKHRGPDGNGIKVLDDGHVFLGHCRLAVIDLSDRASQPMMDSSGNYTVTFNGEIYNYLDLKKEIKETSEYEFRTDSDTEVLLAAYKKWGTKAFSRFNGIFAFALWDDVKKELFLVRDRYGTKPLYYTVIDDNLIFASEYKAFLAYPGFNKEVDLYAVKEYFTFQNLFSNRSFYNSVKMIDAGSYMQIRYGCDYPSNIVRFWDYDFKETDKIISEEECEEELDRLFRQAVKRQLVSDVEIGAYLSGGIDSGGISFVAASSIKELKSFTCGMDLHSASGIELGFDEREKAEYLSYKFGTEHYEIVLKAGDMERCLNQLVWHLEDPRVGQCYPNFYAAKLASKFVKVVLAGAGGDELFAGYPWRYYTVLGCSSFSQYVREYYNYWQRLLNDEERKQMLNPIWGSVEKYDTERVFQNVFSKTIINGNTPEENVNNSLYLESKTFLHGLLIVEDKLSMAHGLETRVPFLDNDLVDFAMRIPVKYKLKNIGNAMWIDENLSGKKVDGYYNINKDGKVILRRMMSRYIPEDITFGRKQGFSSPDASWFRGESMDYVHSIISDSNARLYSYLDKKMVRNCFDKHVDGVKNNRLLIWSIICFEKWLECFE